ncbi:MAG: protein kinase [Deltaproteobacteria bacterium]|nr:protein kinase [Deltaproteobacteria bacterium]
MGGIDYSGQTIDGRYRIVRILGKGGMGAVYLGQHVVIGKQVAIKFLHAEFARKESMVRRFYREARTAAAIGHKNIIDVMDVGVSKEGEPYLVMEYLEGESLSSLLARSGQIDLAAACGILEPTLLALSAAHEKGIVHRDLKPDNIFMVHQPGEAPAVKLIDFGISKFTEDTGQTKLTQTGALVGTPAYMSPEQAKGVGDVDHRADLYSIGVILYEMLTSALPYVGEHYNQLIVNLLTSDPRPPREVYAGFPAEAEDLVLRTLSKDPAKRPQDAMALLEMIKKLSAFSQRRDRLTHYASGVERTCVAAGDLGETISMEESGDVASDVLSSIVGKGTPDGWAKTITSAGSGRGRYIALLSLVAVLCVGAVAFFLWGSRVGQPAAVVPIDRLASPISIEPTPAIPEGVQIEVRGAPPGAKIYYDKAPVPMNPFRVDRKKTLIALKVEAPGYEEHITSLIPDRDRVVEVKLEPKKESEAPTRSISSKRRARGRVATDKTPTQKIEDIDKQPDKTPSVIKVYDESESDKKLSKSGQGTKYSADFE